MRTTIAGGILFLIPVVIILSVARKALVILQPITEPWDKRLNNNIIWGLDGHNLVGIGLLLVICFVAGLVFKVSIVRSSMSKIEKNLLTYIPGYALIKSLATEAFSDSKEDVLTPVLIKDENCYRPGFLVEQHGDFCTVFLPEPPQANAGELQIVPSASVIRLSVSSSAMKFIIRNLGRGVSKLVPQ
jgi:uncharacterized membrane protein